MPRKGMVPHQLSPKVRVPASVLNGPKLGTATSLGAAAADLITQQLEQRTRHEDKTRKAQPSS